MYIYIYMFTHSVCTNACVQYVIYSFVGAYGYIRFILAQVYGIAAVNKNRNVINMLYLFLLIYDFSISDLLLLIWGNIVGGMVMLKLKAVFHSVYGHIYIKADTLARWTQEVNGGQLEPARVPESIMENSGAKNHGKPLIR